MASKAQDPGSGRRGGLFDSVKVLAGTLALLLNIKAFKPQIEKLSIFKSIAGSVLNPLEDAWKFIQGEKCTVFYSGSVAQPEG